MKYFARRQRSGLLTVAVLCALSGAVFAGVHASLRSAAFVSGWMLLLTVVALGLFNARKKLPFVPIGNATAWMEFHIYAGLFSVFLFLSHVGFVVPQGSMEWTLAALYVAVAGSGIIGLALTRFLPHRLNSRGEMILFERIPAIRLGLREEVEGLVLQSAREIQTTTISEFYKARLASFFQRPRNLVQHWLHSEGRFRTLESELWALDRYSNDREREILGEIHERMRLKEDLDFRWAQGVALKGWLFVHIPLTYAFLLVALTHVLLAYGFDGGIR